MAIPQADSELWFQVQVEVHYGSNLNVHAQVEPEGDAAAVRFCYYGIPTLPGTRSSSLLVDGAVSLASWQTLASPE